MNLIGKKAEIIHANGRFSGIITDETKNMLKLKTKNSAKKFIKTTIKLKIEGKIIDGKKIAKRPEERIKAN